MMWKPCDNSFFTLMCWSNSSTRFTLHSLTDSLAPNTVAQNEQAPSTLSFTDSYSAFALWSFFESWFIHLVPVPSKYNFISSPACLNSFTAISAFTTLPRPSFVSVSANTKVAILVKLFHLHTFRMLMNKGNLYKIEGNKIVTRWKYSNVTQNLKFCPIHNTFDLIGRKFTILILFYSTIKTRRRKSIKMDRNKSY